jgi:hypothetical protein
MATHLKGVLHLGSSAIALLLGLIAPLTRASAQTAGSVGAVNPSGTGTPPGGSSRSLEVGSSVVRNERLQTSATGKLHVTFTDKTTLNLGPNTTVVIDKYVYDPASGSGNLQASVKSGLLRFVGGQTSHEGAATVQTPVATIGIRGNMAIVEFNPACGWQITSLAPGVLSVRNRVSEVEITRPGYTVCVASADQVIPQPTRADPRAIQQAFQATLSSPGQSGGATRIPTDDQLARRGLGSAPLPSGSGSALDYSSILSIQQSIGRNAAQGRQPRRVVVPRPPVTESSPETQNPYGNSR